jgi:hypothetical protein
VLALLAGLAHDALGDAAQAVEHVPARGVKLRVRRLLKVLDLYPDVAAVAVKLDKDVSRERVIRQRINLPAAAVEDAGDDVDARADGVLGEWVFEILQHGRLPSVALAVVSALAGRHALDVAARDGDDGSPDEDGEAVRRDALLNDADFRLPVLAAEH